MDDQMRVMTQKPLNAETPRSSLRSWITANRVFFDRNQGLIPEAPIALAQWRLTVTGRVESPLELGFEEILRMPRVSAANTLECSGNSRSLLTTRASGNPWTIGGVGNAVYEGVWLRDVLARCQLGPDARHVAFEGFDTPLGKAKIQFVRSIPLSKALDSTLLAYTMNGEPLPLKHGFPLRALALGWTGANCVKWLRRITVMDRPFEGFFMDKVYREFQKGQESTDGAVVTGIKLKSVITFPEPDQTLAAGTITVLGAAYAGEQRIATVDVSLDDGGTWSPAELIGPDEPYAWRQWQYRWQADRPGARVLMARATDTAGNRQPLEAEWNVLGYGNNGCREHAVRVTVV